jgi:uncharacterized sulfatase
MMILNSIKNYKQVISASLKNYSALSLFLFMTMLLPGLFQMVSIQSSQSAKLPLLALSTTLFINYFVYCLKVFAMLLIPYLISSFISSRLANIFYIFFAVFLIILELLLVQYFNKSMVPLGSDLYAYSFTDIEQTVGASGTLNAFMITAFVGLLIAVISIFIFLPKKININKNITFAATAVAFLFLLTGFRSPQFESLRTEYERTLSLNKSDFFITASYKYFTPENFEADIYSDTYSGDFVNNNLIVKSFNYVNESKYPFLHKEETNDVLSPFFQQSSSRPNIVIILVEGLGRSFTNEGAILGNFTPFLDSLSQQSLYWKNFLSSAGRSFAVLPSVIGSLPFAKNGFNELGNNMPKHLSLASISGHNGYQSSFFYGGDSKFDNMDIFAKKDGINNIYDEKTFPASYKKLPAQNGFTWGYDDKELFKRFLEITPEVASQPQLNIMFTVAMHSPFLLNDQKKYDRLFEKRMDELHFPEAKKSAYRQYKSQYASILFFDEALKEFINHFKQRSDFANTIFVITGDHRMPEIPMISKMERYHVPLVIYSPLLKRTATFSSVSSHFDIAPSLLAFMKNSYSFEIPTLASWMGSGLDTNRTFSNVHEYPLMQTKNEVIDFVQGTNHLNGESGYSILSDMNEEQEDAQSKPAQLPECLKRFKIKNQRFIEGAPLIPDSIYQKYFKK